MHKALERMLKSNETLEQTHDSKTTPAETSYFAVNEATETVREIATMQWQDDNTNVVLVAAKGFGKDVEKGVEAAVMAPIAWEAEAGARAPKAQSAPGVGGGSPPLTLHSEQEIGGRALERCIAFRRTSQCSAPSDEETPLICGALGAERSNGRSRDERHRSRS